METHSEIEIAVEQAKGERLDRWLAQQVPQLSRSQVQRLIEQGHVQVNQQVCFSKKAAVEPGDCIHVCIPAAEPLALQPQAIPLEVLFEDEQLLIVNKPAGLVVHPAPGHPDGTLVNALLAHCDNLAGIGGAQRPGIVHRLDKDTSGAIAIAKTDIAHQHLQAQIAEKTAQRQYLAVIHGCPPEKRGTIDLPVGRHPIDRKKMAVMPENKGGRPAITHWQIEERLGNYSLLHCQLETGRTHQIRVHLSHLGYPIVGDPLYGSQRSVGVNLTGQALHAWRLRVQHPLTEEGIEAIAPAPKAFATLLKVLRKRAASA